MMLPKNAEDPTQYPEIIVAMAISIGATTFMDHPICYPTYRNSWRWSTYYTS